MPEHEHKYDVEADFTFPDLAGVKGVADVGEPVEHTLEATYFDTVDHRLTAAGVLIRRRTGGNDDGWHLKLPSAVRTDVRHELQMGLGRAVRTVPKRLRDTVSGLVGGQAIEPVAVIVTERTARRLIDDEGVVLAEVADDQVAASIPDTGGGPVTWREIEVELIAGDAEVLSRVGKRLIKAGAERTARTSKLSKLIGDPVAEPLGPTRSKDRVQALVAHRLGTQVEVMRRRDPLAREGLPEGVHTMRVAVRRLRSALATSRPFLDRSVTDPIRIELKWVADALGDARDAEVRHERLDDAIDHLVAEHPDIDWDEESARPALWSSLVDRHERAQVTLNQVLTSERYAGLLDALRELVADPPWSTNSTKKIQGAYRRVVERELDRVHERMQAAFETELTTEERAHALHEARKATKRARYAVEPLRPIYGSEAKKLVKRLKGLQSALGLHQDTVVTRAHLLQVSRSKPALQPSAALLAGALVERESRDAERYEEQAANSWRKLTKASLPT